VEHFQIIGETPIFPAEPPRPLRQFDFIEHETDAHYFERRAAEGLAYAAERSEPHLKALHIDLASRYAQLAAALREVSARTD
jgi:hypothetical protein